MVKILTGLAVAVIAFLDYCCCRAASLADRQMEELLLKEREKADTDDE